MKIVNKRTFTHDVKVLTPIDGGFEDENLKTTFNYMTTEETNAFNLRSPTETTAFLEAAVVTFHDLVDEARAPVACTPEIRAGLLVHPNARQALVTHFFDAVTKVKEGN